ncbi:hypothetical protein [Georgfuchsia toluolica]|uniref:hypothetical protein n=1 Tax=Georgfuchsia toluolica TaxID=424218 RepID=UPI001C737079|nr:hypothetical protein [Georgfuchsia toluolica]
MAITILRTKAVTKPEKRKSSGHTKPKQPTTSLDSPGRQMVCNMLAILSVGHTTFCAGIKNGRYPPADGYDGNRPYWLNETVKKFLSESHGAKRPLLVKHHHTNSAAVIAHQTALLASLKNAHGSALLPAVTQDGKN